MDSFSTPHLHAHDFRELFGGWEFAFEFAGELRLQLIGGYADGIGLGAQGILDFDIVFLGAEDDADGGLGFSDYWKFGERAGYGWWVDSLSVTEEYGSGGKSSTWGSAEAFEEDIDGNQDAVFLADEVSGMDVVHTDSGGDVLEDEMVVGGGRWAVGEKPRAMDCGGTPQPLFRG